MNVNRVSTEHKQSVNSFGCCIWYNPRAKLWLLSIVEELATCIGNVVSIIVTTRKDECQQSVKTVSIEHQQSIIRASMILGIASWIIQGRCYWVSSYTKYWPHLGVIWSLSMSLHRKLSVNRASTECQQSVNNLGCCILYYPRAVLRHLHIINLFAAVISKRGCEMVTFRVWKCALTECQQFWCCILYNPRAVLWHLPTTEVVASFIGNVVWVDTATPQNDRQQSANKVSTECQQSTNRVSTEHQHRVNRVSTECP